MTVNESVVGLTAVGALMLAAAPANAQVQADTQEVQVYAGELFGDDVTDMEISGNTPTLDDDVTYGVRYGYNLTEAWGFEVSLGYSPNAITELPGSDVDVDLTTLDFDAVWHINPSGRLVPYLVAGVGYASASLDSPIQGTVNGQPVTIDEDNGFTLNAGVGAKYFATDRVLLRLEARYRYLDSIVDNFDDSLNTFETTLGIGWRF